MATTQTKRRIRKIHHYLGIIIGIQLFFWMISGAYFALIPIETVRGSDRAQDFQAISIDLNADILSPAALQEQLQLSQIRELRLRNIRGQLVYEVYKAGKSSLFVLAHDGSPLKPIDVTQAKQAALADYTNSIDVDSVDLLENPPWEYSGPLPVYRVQLKDSRHTRIYVSPMTGEVLKRRNAYWRVFDIFWRIHIMDFEGENFNNNLLRLISLSGLLLVISGYLLWWVSRKRQRT